MTKKINIFTLLFALFVFIAQAKDYNVKKYGAKADGKTLNTEVLQKLIDKVSKKGGGVLIFPAGKYLTGSLQLQSDVDLYFEEGAVLLGSTNPYDYRLKDIKGGPKKGERDDLSKMALLVARKANNFKLFGKGQIDGQGLKLALAVDSLHHIGELIDPKYNYRRMRPNETARPKLFRFSMCNNVEIRDLTVGGASCWGLSFELCHNLILDGLTVINRSYWNNDGMDITDCVNVRVTNCDVDSADDGICLKSYYPGYTNDSIYIANCKIRSSASAIKFGTASYGGFKNVTIENIEVFDTFRSAIAIESVDGGHIENIEVSNIVAKNTGNAIFIRLGHRGGKNPGVVKNIYIHDIKVEVPFGRPDIDYDLRGPEVNFFHNPFPSSIVGIPGHQVENVLLENIEISYPGRATKSMAYVPVSRLQQVPEKIKDYPEFSMFGELPAWAMYVRHASGIEFKGLTFKLNDKDFRPAMVFDNTTNIKLENIVLPEGLTNQIVVRNVKGRRISKPLSKQVVSVD